MSPSVHATLSGIRGLKKGREKLYFHMKFYRIIIQSYDKECGVIYAPQDWDYPVSQDGEIIKDWQSLTLELKDGTYTHYHMCIGGANLVDDNLKDLFEEYVTDDTQVEFLPVSVNSETYGAKQYYILHFKKIHDVLDIENTIYSDCNKSSIIKPAFSISKIKDLHLFNSRPFISDVNISETIYKEILKRKLNKGIMFQQIKCVD